MEKLMEKFLALVAVVLGFTALLVGLGALMAIPTMYILNYLFSSAFLTLVFGVAKVGFWRSWVFNIFCGLFLKNYASSSKK